MSWILQRALVLRIMLLLAAIIVAVLGLTSRQYQGRISGGCSQTLSPFLRQATPSGSHVITFCNFQNADIADLVLQPIPAGNSSVTVEVAGYGDAPGISAKLVGADGTQAVVPLPRAGDRWVRWLVDIPPALQTQDSRLIVRDQTQEGFGWIGLGIVSDHGGWIPVSIGLVLLAVLYPWLRQEIGTTVPVEAKREAHQQIWIGLSIAAATLLALVLRRPSQWTNPYVWVEDGKELLPDFLQYGWGTLVHPVAGYILIPNKLINSISVTLSFRWLPEISLSLAALMTMAVMVALALLPTRLRAPWACALAVLAVPTDAEVFSTSAYALWWGAFLVVIPVFWDERRAPGLQWRFPMLLLGGLSSPLVVMMAPLYCVRAIILRQREEWWMLLTAGAIGAVQAKLVVLNPVASQERLSAPGVSALLERFVGHFLFRQPNAAQPALAAGLGLALILVILVAVWAQRRNSDGVLVTLIACFVLSVTAAAARVPIDLLDPFTGGPRYFFYPYIFLAWILIHIASEARGPARLIFVLLLLFPLQQTLQHGYRTHAPLDWREEVKRCTSGQTDKGPAVHWTGQMAYLWHAPLTAEQCRQLVRNSLFDNKLTYQDLPSTSERPPQHRVITSMTSPNHERDQQ
ncbi:hypothetical protein [Xanthomonas axonopodis]|uniref:hypothetical protein n=2 Tax=Xanthomonas axonopodis TaxID=53413 RepID=UPI000AD3F314|nr:hypothetical protein [Xanthomonas axonopodis]